nr:ankyrin repeat protein [Pandoravirus massiliensis]
MSSPKARSDHPSDADTKFQVDATRVTLDDLPDETLVSIARFVNCDDVAWCLARLSRRWRRVARDRPAFGPPPCYRGRPVNDNVLALYWHDGGCPQWHVACRDAILDGAPRDTISALARSLACRTPYADRWTAQAAAAAASIDMVDAYAAVGYEGVTAPVLRAAARAGSINILRHIATTHDAAFWRPDLPAEAASMGQVAALAFLHRSGCPWGKRTSEAAAAAGHLNCLAYAYEYDCPWDTRTLCAIAARAGHDECVRYIDSHGPPERRASAPEANLDGRPATAHTPRGDMMLLVFAVFCLLAAMALGSLKA